MLKIVIPKEQPTVAEKLQELESEIAGIKKLAENTKQELETTKKALLEGRTK